MKKLSKIMLSVAAASAVAATMAISAMAEDTIEGTYDSGSGLVTITSTVNPTGASQTLLVLNNVDNETVKSTDIVQIDQKDDGTSFGSFVLPAGITEGTYYIRIGGSNGTIQYGTLVIKEEEDVKTITIKVGDVNLDGEFSASDVTALKRYVGEYTSRTASAGTEIEVIDE